MRDNIYCGSKDVPKNKVRGTMQQCAEKGEIRYYGIKKIDPLLANSITKKKKNTAVKVWIKLVAAKSKVANYKSKVTNEKDQKKKKEYQDILKEAIINMENLRKEFRQLQAEEEKTKNRKR